MKLKFTAILLISFLGFGLFAEEYRFVLNSGLDSPVTTMFLDEETNYLVNISDNGQVLLLDTTSQRVVKTYTLSSEKIIDIAINPVYPEVAIISLKGLEFQMEIWDWHRGVRLFQQEQESKPLFIRYTQSGDALVLGQSDQPSITFYDHQNGENLDYLKGSVQLFQDVYVGASGKTLMGYSLSGDLEYIQISSNKELGKVETINGLSNIQVIQIGDKILSLGTDAISYYLLNRQTGELLDKIELNGSSIYSVDSILGILTFIVEERGNQYLSQYKITEQGFEESYLALNLGNTQSFTSIESIDNLCYLGTDKGSFFLYYMDSQESIPFFDETLLTIHSIESYSGDLYIAGEDKLIRITSPLMSDNGNWDDMDKVKQVNQVYPHSGRFILQNFTDSLIGYSNSSEYPSPLLITDQEGLLTRDSVMAEELVDAIDIDHMGSSLLTFGSKKDFTVYNRETGTELYYWNAPAMEHAIFLDEENVLIGKSLSPDSTGSALETINIRTGETAPITSELFHVLGITREDDQIFISGLRESDDIIYTSLIELSTDNTSRSKELLSIAYEDYGSKLFYHDSKIYITLDGLGFIIFDGRRSRTIETARDIKDMTFTKDKIILLYSNNSMGFMDENSLVEKIEMSIFSDYSWLSVYSDYSSYIYTPEAKDNFFVYRVIRR